MSEKKLNEIVNNKKNLEFITFINRILIILIGLALIFIKKIPPDITVAILFLSCLLLSVFIYMLIKIRRYEKQIETLSKECDS